MTDSKALKSGSSYSELPNYISITILSYDPFLAGDMFYRAETILTSHPNLEYDEGRLFIYLYANGRPNCKDESYGKKVHELLKYIVTGEKPTVSNSTIDELDNIVTKVKSRAEVTSKYMKQWDRERSIARDIARDIKKDTSEKDAIKHIRFCRSNGISDASIRQNLLEDYEFTETIINDLFKQAAENDNQSNICNT